MSACTFFGHRDAPEGIYSAIVDAIKTLVAQNHVTDFYVGTHGAFDRLVYRALQQAKTQYPHIRIGVVLAYMPTNKDNLYGENGLLPDGIETVPKRYAIHYRNRWMLDRASYVIGYIHHTCGGAARYIHTAKQQGKTVILL